MRVDGDRPELAGEAEKLLRCPASGNEVEISYEDGMVYVKDSTRTYPIRDGIIDFIPDISDKISGSYDAMSSAYDSMLDGSSVFARLYNSLVWGIKSDREYVDRVLGYVPDGFDGWMLDVPAGTGVFTCEKYARMKDAGIICVDYSPGMLRKAKEAYAKYNVGNVMLVRADVGSLPLKDSCADLLLTMNGMHAFPDKAKALAEMTRVLRNGGRLCGCFYVSGKRRFTDLFVSGVYARTGAFTPPFYDERQFVGLLDKDYDVADRHCLKSLFNFNCTKR